MKKAVNKYDPASPPDNAKAIAAGNLQFLVDYLRELGRLAFIARPVPPPNPETPNSKLLERAQYAREYAEALMVHMEEKERGQPRKFFTSFDAMRAFAAAAEYTQKKGTRPSAQLEKEIMQRYGVTRAVLRAALRDELPPVEWPGFPNAD